MAPKKRKVAAEGPRAQRTVERVALPKVRPASSVAKDVCGACLLPLEPGARIGAIDNCEHVFHFECVERWSNTENTCPQCKVRFFWLASYSSDGKRQSLAKVQRRDQEAPEEEEFEDIQVCEVCKQAGDEGALLLCDGMQGTCNAAYHLHCVGLVAVPRVSWFCPDCTERGFDTDARGRRRCQQLPAAPASTEAAGVERGSSQAPAPSVPEATAADLTKRPASASGNNAGVELAQTSAAAGTEASASGHGSDAIPAQFRLNSRAFATALVEEKSCPAPVASQGGLFATFAQRRRMRRAERASGLHTRDVEASTGATQGFIELNPTYEDGFIGRSE